VESDVKIRVISADSGPLEGNILIDLFRYRALIKNLVVKDLRLKYRDAFLGFMWSLALPLFTILVYYFAFDVILRIGFPNYPVFLIAGLLSWNFFAASITSSTTAIIGNSSLMRKIAFPWQILPVSCVLYHLTQLVIALAVFFPVILLFSGLGPVWHMLFLLPLVSMHTLFTIGVGLALSVMATLWRDVRHLTEMALPLLFWMAPILYPVERAPAPVQMFFQVNPLAAYAIAYQDILFRGHLPTPAVSVTIAAWTAISLLGGYAIFRAYYTRLVEEL
jgi:ABC-type polysaccharide/polyol phosphate export permease